MAEFQIEFLSAVKDTSDDNIDVVVTLEDGSKHGATFFTPKNITTLMAHHEVTGENCHGRYEWCVNMIVVRELTTETVKEVVADIIREGQLESAFMPLQKEELKKEFPPK